MANQRVLRFPAGFLWGTATSSYQCEGDNTNNQWYRWEQEGHILSGEHCGTADNWWQNTERDFNYFHQSDVRKPLSFKHGVSTSFLSGRDGTK